MVHCEILSDPICRVHFTTCLHGKHRSATRSQDSSFFSSVLVLILAISIRSSRSSVIPGRMEACRCPSLGSTPHHLPPHHNRIRSSRHRPQPSRSPPGGGRSRWFHPDRIDVLPRSRSRRPSGGWGSLRSCFATTGQFRSKRVKQARGSAMAPSMADRGGVPMRELERQFMCALRKFPKVRGTAVRRRERDGKAGRREREHDVGRDGARTMEWMDGKTPGRTCCRRDRKNCTRRRSDGKIGRSRSGPSHPSSLKRPPSESTMGTKKTLGLALTRMKTRDLR